MPFLEFFGATLLGKAFIKVNLQASSSDLKENIGLKLNWVQFSHHAA
jgi:hypothetical protein